MVIDMTCELCSVGDNYSQMGSKSTAGRGNGVCQCPAVWRMWYVRNIVTTLMGCTQCWEWEGA